MPTNRTKRTRNRAGALDHWKVDDLVTGQCLLSAGYTPPNNRNGCGHWSAEDWAEVHAQMRADWEIHGHAVMAWWRGENERWTSALGSPENQRDNMRQQLARQGQTQPWAFREFGAPNA